MTDPATDSRPRIVLDCDPGVDDMFAIFTALRYCDLAAIVTVAGNVGIEHTTRNALAICELVGTDVPVFRGSEHPLASSPVEDARDVHGADGLGGVTLPVPTRDVAGTDPIEALAALVADEPTFVVAVGPLTNIARVIERYPDWPSQIAGLAVMGGSADSGNVTATAEFNIWSDPEAAAAVFATGMPITMAGLNLTRQVTMGVDEIATLRAAGTDTAIAAAGALDFYSEVGVRTYGVKESAMHDPCAVLSVVQPHLFTSEALHVTVEVNGAQTRGMTVCDQRPGASPGSTQVLMTADRTATVESIVTAAIEPTPATPAG